MQMGGHFEMPIGGIFDAITQLRLIDTIIIENDFRYGGTLEHSQDQIFAQALWRCSLRSFGC
jgi:hypothetical protein